MKLTMAAATLLMLAVLCAACASTGGEAPKPAPTFTEAQKAELAEGVFKLLKDRCAECHQAGAPKIYAKIDYMLDYEKLVKSRWVKLDAPERSALYTECEEGSMPLKLNADGKPKIKDPLPQAQVEMLLQWLQAGAPKWKGQ